MGAGVMCGEGAGTGVGEGVGIGPVQGTACVPMCVGILDPHSRPKNPQCVNPPERIIVPLET